MLHLTPLDKIIYYAADQGFKIFLDLKVHDIPNTVKKSIQGLASLPIKMLTIHISGGKRYDDGCNGSLSKTQIKVFGVTALTSLSDDEIDEIFQNNFQKSK